VANRPLSLVERFFNNDVNRPSRLKYEALTGVCQVSCGTAHDWELLKPMLLEHLEGLLKPQRTIRHGPIDKAAR
jgi:hypothetical protein